MDSTKPLSYNVVTYKNSRNCLKQGALEVVARDGIEPPTPAFSGLRSNRFVCFNIHARDEPLGSKSKRDSLVTIEFGLPDGSLR